MMSFLVPTESQAEAVKTADAYLNNAGMPTYSDVVKRLRGFIIDRIDELDENIREDKACPNPTADAQAYWMDEIAVLRAELKKLI